MTNNEQFIPFSISVENAEQAQSLLNILDAANRHLGVQAAGPCFHWITKLQSASRLAQTASQQTKPSDVLAESA